MPPAVFWCEAPLAPSLRELLSEREAEGVRYDERFTSSFAQAARYRNKAVG